LPEELVEPADIRAYFRLDSYQQMWIPTLGPDAPEPECFGAGLIRDKRDYEQLRPKLYPADAVDHETLRTWAREHENGETVVWITLEGFFWFPRTLLGIERHMYAFYDQPELIHRINADLAAFHKRVLDEVMSICPPDFMTFAEDMSYNKGPMLSKSNFDEFLAPYYRQIVPILRKARTCVFVDSDGDIAPLMPWLQTVGVQGILPLERMAGVDVRALREKHPELRMIGAYDKTVMDKGEEAMRAEFERLMPVMRQGGFIPSVDHQTPPGVSLEDYRLFLSLLREYCERATDKAT
jgi:hypothetical protein